MMNNFKLILIAHAALSMVDKENLPLGGMAEDWIMQAEGAINATVKLWPRDKEKNDG